jgi:hypothetical protein
MAHVILKEDEIKEKIGEDDIKEVEEIVEKSEKEEPIIKKKERLVLKKKEDKSKPVSEDKTKPVGEDKTKPVDEAPRKPVVVFGTEKFVINVKK